jgi:gluconolactonase
MQINKIVFYGLLAMTFIGLTHCTSSSGTQPDWQKKNDKLIEQHNLTVKKLSGLPQTAVASNLKEAKVESLDKLDSIEMYPGVHAKIFWGSGVMVGVLQLAPNAKIGEEVLPADRIVFVLEGSIEQLVNGASVAMMAKKREAPDGTHSGTPRTDFVYLEKGSKNAVMAGASGARLLEVYSPFRLDYLQKAGLKNLPT